MLREPRAYARHGDIVDAPQIRATGGVDDLHLEELQELWRLEPIKSIRQFVRHVSPAVSERGPRDRAPR
jgi:hypothetical protein